MNLKNCVVCGKKEFLGMELERLGGKRVFVCYWCVNVIHYLWNDMGDAQAWEAQGYPQGDDLINELKEMTKASVSIP